MFIPAPFMVPVAHYNDEIKGQITKVLRRKGHSSEDIEVMINALEEAHKELYKNHNKTKPMIMALVIALIVMGIAMYTAMMMAHP